MLYSLISQSLLAGIVYDLTDPTTTKSFVQAVEDANESLSSESVSKMGSAPVACEVPPKKTTTEPASYSVRKAVPLNPNSDREFIAAKENAVIDTFQMVEEKNYTCGMFSKVDLKGPDGKKIKSVCPEFLDQLATYGLAKLENGQVVQFSKTVKVEKIINGVKGLYWEKRFALANPNCPDGQTANGVCLEPYRSILVSKHLGFAPGDIVYFDDFRDVIIPPGVRHGGYFVVAAVKKTDESLKPEVSVFVGTDSHERNALLASVQAYTKDGLKLSKVTGESRKDAEWFINEKRQAAKEIIAKRMAEGNKGTSFIDRSMQSVSNFFDRQQISEDKEVLNGDGWESDYTDYVVDAIDDNSPLMSLDTEEIALLCPRFGQMNPSEKKLFWAHFFKALAVPESGTNPYKGMVEANARHKAGDLALNDVAGTKVQKTSEGLLQLSYQDALGSLASCDFDYKKDYPVFKHVVAARVKARAESTKYEEPEGYKRRSADLDSLVAMGYLDEKHLSAAKNLDIYDPKKNLQCGVKILENQLRIPRPLQSNKIYYWSVLVDTNTDSNGKFNTALKKSEPFCSVNYTKPSVAKNKTTIPDSAPPQGYENGNFKLNLSSSERDRIARAIADNNSGSYSAGKVETVKTRLERDADKITNFHMSSSYDGPTVANPTDLTNKMKHLMNDLSQDPRGRYAMLDYMEFKGDGLSSNERVLDANGNKTNAGFGLYQVLASAASEYDGTQDPSELFAKHANIVLDNRIRISDKTPTDKNGLSKYKKEWGQRTASYGAKTGSIAQGKDRTPAAKPGDAPSVDEEITDLPPMTVPVALASEQPFMSEGKLVWEGKFPEVNCEEWGLSGANFCFPEPGRIVLNPSHSEGMGSRRNSRNDGHGGEFFHEGRMNVSTSLIIKSAIDKCLAKSDGYGGQVPQVRMSRWPGDHQFGMQEFGKALGGEIQTKSPRGGREDYIEKYLLGNGSMDQDIASKSLFICVDYNAGLGNSGSRDYSLAIKPRSSRWDDNDDSHEINQSMSDYMEKSMLGFLENLGQNSPVENHREYVSNSRVVDETHTSEGIGMFNLGNNGTKHSTIEGFFMDGAIGERVALKMKSDNPNNYFEFGLRKLVYDTGIDSWVKEKEPIEPKYRVTQEHLMVARGVALGIMHNKEYQCQQ
jgi:hypothetical protein